MKFYYYKISNIKNGSFYIGITTDYIKRKKQHFNNLKNKSHEFVYGTKPLDGPAENIHDVFASNGWKCGVVEKQPNSLTLKCYTRGTAMAANYSEPSELVADMNAYYQRKGKPLTATLISDDENGVYIKVVKNQ